MSHGFAIAAVVAASTFGAEAIAFPRASLRRPLAAILLHLAVLVALAAGSLAITARPFFSFSVVVVLVVLLAVISNAKYESLREPFVFSDLSLFSQVFSHPRLYLPFLGTGKIVAIVVGVAAAVVGFMLETPLPMLARGVAGAIAVLGWLICLVFSRRLPLTLEPMADQRRCGFLAVFVSYLVNGLGGAEKRAFYRAVQAGPFSRGLPEAQPDVIVIQSESYFDARRLGKFVLPDSYANFDRARREAFEQGKLTVPAWGANTMRSEFALLTGLPSGALGYARFYPYMYVRRACASLAGYFRRGGYRTVAVHPYYANFFGRRRAFQFMQFDRMLDIHDFETAVRVGPYVGDNSVADTIISLLQVRDEKPVFAFAITMENHGPLHLEMVAPGESASEHTLGDDARWRDLTAYLRHVKNADAMIGKLTAYLRKRERPTVLCFYGDHVPALGSIFDALGSQPTHSDYVIWRNFGADFGEQRDAHVENLGSAIQRALMHDDCISADLRNEMQQTPA